PAFQLERRLHTLVAEGGRHPYVKDGQIWLKPLNLGQERLCLAERADRREPCFVEQSNKPFTKQHRIVCKHDAQRLKCTVDCHPSRIWAQEGSARQRDVRADLRWTAGRAVDTERSAQPM